MDTDATSENENIGFSINLDEMTQITSDTQNDQMEFEHCTQENNNDETANSIDPAQIEQDLQNVQEELAAEIMRITTLAKKSTSDLDSYRRTLQRLVQRLRRAKTPNQATSTLISLNARANCTSKQSKRINAQPTSVSRRREGVGRGCGRIDAGRPPNKMPKAKRSMKPQHKLANSIARKKGHPKGHGH